MDARGALLGLREYAAKGVLVSFWATCRPSWVEAIPCAHRLASRHQRAGCEILSVIFPEGWERIGAFLRRTALDFPMLLDR